MYFYVTQKCYAVNWLIGFVLLLRFAKWHYKETAAKRASGQDEISGHHDDLVPGICGALFSALGASKYLYPLLPGVAWASCVALAHCKKQGGSSKLLSLLSCKSTNLWQPQQGASRASEKQRDFAIAFLCRACFGGLPSKYWLCLAPRISKRGLYHDTFSPTSIFVVLLTYRVLWSIFRSLREATVTAVFCAYVWVHSDCVGAFSSCAEKGLRGRERGIHWDWKELGPQTCDHMRNVWCFSCITKW